MHTTMSLGNAVANRNGIKLQWIAARLMDSLFDFGSKFPQVAMPGYNFIPGINHRNQGFGQTLIIRPTRTEVTFRYSPLIGWQLF
ncbi:hypothetical protein SDC9_160197 [bioreactor metagenome]|uniref:Uncharacterized protein n=1 Tax=bioreactor metagenome TaxID=1076179 RepID=A0A645FEZ0_9ZZZZ